MMIQIAKGRYWKLVLAISFTIAIIVVTALSRDYALAKSRSGTTLGNEIKQELIGILNRPEVSSSFNEVFQKHGISQDKTVAVEFRLSDEPQNLASNRFSLTSKTPASSIAIKGQQVLRASSVWYQPCPDPGIAPDGCWM